MARCQQQVIFLKQCKNEDRFPPTIENINLPSFFEEDKMKNSGNFIRRYVLNKTIRHVNGQAAKSKLQLSQDVCHIFEKFSEPKAIGICSVIEDAFQRSKSFHERRLSNKTTHLQDRAASSEAMKECQTTEAMVTDLTGTLEKDEISLLAKGPKFALTEKINELDIRSNFCQLAYQLRWRAIMSKENATNENATPETLQRYPQSTYISQPFCNNHELEAKLKTCYTKVMEITQQLTKRKPISNISASERRVLKRLQTKDYTFLPSDKGSEFCVIENNKYDDAALEHLSDTSTYKQVAHMTAKTIEGKINACWTAICSQSNIKKSITRSYVSTNTDLPKFYCLIKTHKAGPELRVRPIVSNKGSPSFKLSWLLNRLLSPLLSSIPSHLENSLQLLETIQAFPKGKTKQFPYPFSLDVVSLYTSIPPGDAILAICEHLHTNPDVKLPLTTTHIMELLSSILQNTFLEYRGSVFHQVCGLPIGNSISGLLAMVYMARIESRPLSGLQIGLYKRYVDDIIILTTSKEEAEKIFNSMNGLNDNIRFEIEHPDDSNSISLLDFCLTIDKDGNPHFRFYKKCAKKNMFPHVTSALPMEVKHNAIRNEIQRISKRCSSLNDRKTAISKFKNELSCRGYFQMPERRRPTRPIEPKGGFCYFQFPFVNDSTHRAIKKVFKTAQLPVRVYCANRNLRSHLSRRNVEEPCRMKKCNLKDDKLCNTKRCVYEMRCSKCSKIYIGSTIRQLHTRIKEHYQTPSSSVYKHRADCGADFEVKVIARDRVSNRLRFKEAVFIKERCPEINSKMEREELLHLIF